MTNVPQYVFSIGDCPVAPSAEMVLAVWSPGVGPASVLVPILRVRMELGPTHVFG
jgi:hypothetical protein